MPSIQINPPGAHMLTPEELRTWLTERVATYLDRSVDSIEPAQALAEIGLDSVYALTLCGEIEDKLGIEVEPTLAWDYPTINAIAQYLCARLAAGAALA